MGYTHVEFLPLAEHPLDASWGYQVSGYHALSSRYGEPQDFMAFVDACHQAGIGVLLDWVPAHFPRDEHGLSRFDGTHLYSHADPRLGEQPQWGTRVFNFGRNEVRNFLLSNALFWLRSYHVDGLRVDAVSSMLYLNFGREVGESLTNEEGGHENLDAIRFLRDFNVAVHADAPGAITIAEEASAWPGVSLPVDAGGLGFTLKWNMGWMNDTLAYLRAHPADRRLLHERITFSLMYAFSENFVLPFSHDEVVHLKGSMLGKMAGDWWQQFATLRALYLYMLAHPGKNWPSWAWNWGSGRNGAKRGAWTGTCCSGRIIAGCMNWCARQIISTVRCRRCGNVISRTRASTGSTCTTRNTAAWPGAGWAATRWSRCWPYATFPTSPCATTVLAWREPAVTASCSTAMTPGLAAAGQAPKVAWRRKTVPSMAMSSAWFWICRRCPPCGCSEGRKAERALCYTRRADGK